MFNMLKLSEKHNLYLEEWRWYGNPKINGWNLYRKVALDTVEIKKYLNRSSYIGLLCSDADLFITNKELCHWSFSTIIQPLCGATHLYLSSIEEAHKNLYGSKKYFYNELHEVTQEIDDFMIRFHKLSAFR